MADTNHRPETPRGLRRQLNTHGTATMLELREFLGKMKGRRPQEVLGLIAQSSLVQGMLWSTALVLVLLVGATFTVWGVKKAQGDFEPVANKTVAPAAAAAPQADSAAANASDPNAATPPGTPGAANTANNNSPMTPTDPATASQPPLDPLGIGETKVADPRRNPLENRGDDILNELNKR